MNLKLPLCVDISHWETVADFTRVDPFPTLVIAKATEALSYVDPTFMDYFPRIKAAGIARGTFHFFRKVYDATKQALHFCDVIQPYVEDDDLLILDFEEGGEQALQLIAFLDVVEARYPRNIVMLYTRKNIADPITMTATQAARLRSFPIWSAGYPNNPDLFDSPPGGQYGYIPDQAKYGPVWLWQYTDKGIINGIGGEVDCNWISPALLQILRAVPPPSDVRTQLYPDVVQYSGTQNGWRWWLQVIDRGAVRYEVANDALWTVSSAVDTKDAQLGWNGSNYDRITREIQKGEISLKSSGDIVPFGWEANINGVRAIIKDGVINPRLYWTDATATEGHSRCCFGKTADGKTMHFVCEGAYPNQGLRLSECAEIMKRYGCVLAGDAGGGGDTTLVIGGQLINTPEDIDNGVHVERRLPQVLLAYVSETGDGTMQYKANVDAKLWAAYTNGILSNQVTTIKAGTLVTGYAAVNGVIKLATPAGYTKALWFTAVQAPVDPPPTTTKTPFTLTVQGFKPFSGELEKA